MSIIKRKTERLIFKIKGNMSKHVSNDFKFQKNLHFLGLEKKDNFNDYLHFLIDPFNRCMIRLLPPAHS